MSKLYVITLNIRKPTTAPFRLMMNCAIFTTNAEWNGEDTMMNDDAKVTCPTSPKRLNAKAHGGIYSCYPACGVARPLPRHANTLATLDRLNIKAQGCAYARYTGNAMKIKFNPGGVEHSFSANKIPAGYWHDFNYFMCNPSGVGHAFLRLPRVARIRATLGFDVQPLRGCFFPF